ncbi:MAG TPA: folylpolyglutamate synthase/dihydrofolate synthase family protein [Planctomycetota bacterium]|nr:folylpolyglutamate synthase/dihydrofolate synthase family protein [Planctomycetota bacterium]
MSPSWSYEQARAYLNSRTNYEKKWPTYGPVTFSLERMRRLNALVGDPHERYRKVHITGTKGKGSTAAMVTAILRAAGLAVGTYTSPHLVNLEERIQLNGEEIPKDRLAAIVERISGPVERIRGIAPPPHPTFFEIFTTAAFCWFAEAEADWGVIEVGLGGRLDSTNIILPDATAVTRIGLDHTNILGNTVARIATEKAGIFKEGIPVVIAPQEESAGRVLRGIAGSVHAEVWGVGREITFGDVRSLPDRPGYRFHVGTPHAGHTNLEIPLVGKHQVENAAVAVGIIDALRKRGALDVTDAAIADGLAKVRAPGRVEVMGTSPLVVVDGAHNPLSMGALVNAVREHFTWRRLVLLFAMATDKDIRGSLEMLLPLADEVFFTVTNSPRATKPATLRQLAIARGKAAENVHCIDDEPTAFREALAATHPEDLLLVTGSLYLAGDLRPVIQQETLKQQDAKSLRR